MFKLRSRQESAQDQAAATTRLEELRSTNRNVAVQRTVARTAFLNSLEGKAVISPDDGRMASAAAQDTTGEFPAVPRHIEVEDQSHEAMVAVQHPDQAPVAPVEIK